MTPVVNRRFVSRREAADFFQLLVSVVETEKADHSRECPYWAQCSAPSCPLTVRQHPAREGEPSCAFSS